MTTKNARQTLTFEVRSMERCLALDPVRVRMLLKAGLSPEEARHAFCAIEAMWEALEVRTGELMQ